MAQKFDVNNVLQAQDDSLTNNSFDDLFGTDFGNDIFSNETDSSKLMSMAKETDINRLHPSPRNPYKVLDNDDMAALVASIESEGILNPLVARPAGGKELELVSGHRRLYAAQKIGLKKVPVIIKQMTSEQADVWMVDLNLNRETILPSEKAKAIKLKYDAIKRSRGGARTPSNENAQTHDSAQIIAKEMGMTDRNLRRYLLFADMNEELLDKIDSGKLIQRIAEQLAYLTPSVQSKVNDLLNSGETITQDIAKQLKLNFANVDEVSDGELTAVLKGKPKKTAKAKNIIKKIEKELQVDEIDFTTSKKDREATLNKIALIRARLDEIEQNLM